VETFTFLFTDIEGSTALLQRLGEGLYVQLLAGHHALIRSGLAAHDGKEVDTQGDAFFAVFSSPTACMAAVTQMQRALAAHAWPAGEHVRVRMGVHTGEAEKTAAGLVGLDVHRAARVAAVGYGGQVLVSGTAAALVRDALPPGAALAGSGCAPAEGPGTPGTGLPAPGGGPAGRVPAAALAGQPGAGEQSPGPAGGVHRP
jgi:class 3 adenylate cyclase